jgi:hypothetical protein
MPPSLALLPARLAPAALRDEAWALKQACHAAWSCQPQQAVQAAQALRRLSEQVDHVDPELQAEVVALADWTEGIACLTQGRLEDACGALDRAEAGFARIGQALACGRDAGAQDHGPDAAGPPRRCRTLWRGGRT